ncbi:MAG: hypothetical protein ACK528_08165 [Alphaproteobacteria bacterium]
MSRVRCRTGKGAVEVERRFGLEIAVGRQLGATPILLGRFSRRAIGAARGDARVRAAKHIGEHLRVDVGLGGRRQDACRPRCGALRAGRLRAVVRPRLADFSERFDASSGSLRANECARTQQEQRRE